MATLNLVHQDKSDISWKLNRFPDGEVMIELGTFDRKEEICVWCRIRNAEELFVLMQVGDILNRHEVIWSLRITYLMSGRMDRVMDFNRPFSLQVVSKMINSLNPSDIYMEESHSFRTCKELNFSSDSYYAYPDKLKEAICLPDDGAKKRYENYLYRDNYILCEKVRDKDGRLTSFKISDWKLKDDEIRTIWVIDDLCDGGGTFIGIAELLRNEFPNAKLNLKVTHAVQFTGIKKVASAYDEVHITDSYEAWQTKEVPNNVVVTSVFNYAK